MANRRRGAVAAALGLVLVLCCDVWAGPPTETLHDVFMKVERLLAEPGLRETPANLLAAIRNVVNDRFDVREATRLALGREWHSRTSMERHEFGQLFGELLEHAYVSRIASRADVRRGLAIRYLGEAIDGDRATVTTTIECRDGGETSLEYRMIQHGNRWAVYDILIDGISLVANYRAQFDRTIRRSSYPELVALLKAKIAGTPSVSTVADEAPVSTPATRDAPRVAVSRAAVTERDAGIDRDTSLDVSPVPVTTAPYWIQMGAFSDPDAGELASRLLEQNLPVSIDAVALPSGHRGQLLLRVRVGPFSDRAEAASKLRNLQTNGYQPLLARDHD